MNFMKCVAALGLTLALVACGGGGGSAGTPITGSSPAPSDPTTAVAQSFVFSLDKSTLSNAGGDESLLTVTVLDAARNVLAGVPVAVAVDSGVYTPISATTDDSGQVTGNISIGSDKSNRIIAATVNVPALPPGTASVAVIGSQLSLTAVPATPGPGASVQVSIKATDANGAGIVGATIQLGGTLGFTQQVVTDASGNATATLGAAPIAVDVYTVTAVGLGVNVLRDVQVAGAGGGIDDVLPGEVISSPSLAITPNTISPNAEGSTTNRAVLRAIFQNASNQAIRNVRVRFVIDPPGLGSGEEITTGSNIVYSDVNGVAFADYVAGTRSSPTNGVKIRACYGYSDADMALPCNKDFLRSITASMTVAGQPLSITLGDNNELSRGGFNLTYIKKFDVAVADAAGNAVPNAIVSASVDLTYYGKGLYANPRLWCLNQDTNRNGFLDANEMLYPGHSVLAPRKADVILSFLGTNTTGANGRATIQVEYPQNVATWLDYSLRVTTNVAGSEGTAIKNYFTTFIDGDDANGSFLTPPYGINSCSMAN